MRFVEGAAFLPLRHLRCHLPLAGEDFRYFWAVPAGFDLSPLDGPAFLPARTGVIVADRYDAEIVREATTEPLPAHVRKRCTLALARRAARRRQAMADPEGAPGFTRATAAA